MQASHINEVVSLLYLYVKSKTYSLIVEESTEQKIEHSIDIHNAQKVLHELIIQGGEISLMLSTGVLDYTYAYKSRADFESKVLHIVKGLSITNNIRLGKEILSKIIELTVCKSKVTCPNQLQLESILPYSKAIDLDEKLTLPDNSVPQRDPKLKIYSGESKDLSLNEITLARAYNLELSACEIYALMINRYGHQNSRLTLGLSQLCMEEAKHCSWLLSELKQRGFNIYSVPIHLKLWDRISPEKTIENCIASQTVLGEGHSLGNDLNLAHKYELLGDFSMSRLYKEIHKEELWHVSFGNFWLQELTNENRSQLIDQVKSRNKSISSKVIDVKDRLLVGFSIDEIKTQILEADPDTTIIEK